MRRMQSGLVVAALLGAVLAGLVPATAHHEDPAPCVPEPDHNCAPEIVGSTSSPVATPSSRDIVDDQGQQFSFSVLVDDDDGTSKDNKDSLRLVEVWLTRIPDDLPKDTLASDHVCPQAEPERTILPACLRIPLQQTSFSPNVDDRTHWEGSISIDDPRLRVGDYEVLFVAYDKDGAVDVADVEDPVEIEVEGRPSGARVPRLGLVGEPLLTEEEREDFESTLKRSVPTQYLSEGERVRLDVWLEQLRMVTLQIERDDGTVTEEAPMTAPYEIGSDASLREGHQNITVRAYDRFDRVHLEDTDDEGNPLSLPYWELTFTLVVDREPPTAELVVPKRVYPSVEFPALLKVEDLTDHSARLRIESDAPLWRNGTVEPVPDASAPRAIVTWNGAPHYAVRLDDGKIAVEDLVNTGNDIVEDELFVFRLQQDDDDDPWTFVARSAAKLKEEANDESGPDNLKPFNQFALGLDTAGRLVAALDDQNSVPVDGFAGQPTFLHALALARSGVGANDYVLRVSDAQEHVREKTGTITVEQAFANLSVQRIDLLKERPLAGDPVRFLTDVTLDDTDQPDMDVSVVFRIDGRAPVTETQNLPEGGAHAAERQDVLEPGVHNITVEAKPPRGVTRLPGDHTLTREFEVYIGMVQHETGPGKDAPVHNYLVRVDATGFPAEAVELKADGSLGDAYATRAERQGAATVHVFQGRGNATLHWDPLETIDFLGRVLDSEHGLFYIEADKNGDPRRAVQDPGLDPQQFPVRPLVEEGFSVRQDDEEVAAELGADPRDVWQIVIEEEDENGFPTEALISFNATALGRAAVPITTFEANSRQAEGEDSPGLGALLVVGLLGLLAAAMRRRR